MSEEGESLLACTEEKPGLNHLFQSLIRLVIFDEVIRFLKLAQLVCLSGRCDFDEGRLAGGMDVDQKAVWVEQAVHQFKGMDHALGRNSSERPGQDDQVVSNWFGLHAPGGSKVFKAQIMESDLVF